MNIQKTRQFTYIIVISVLLLVGCSSDDANVTYVVIPAGQDPTTTQIAPEQPVTIPATAIPSPTPDVSPEVSLQMAERYWIDGYFEQAIFAYQSVISRLEAPENIRAAAAFGMGRAALREGLFQNAVDAMTMLITQFTSDERIAQAYFLRGDAYLGLSQWQLSINDFQQYLALRPGLIDSYVYERIGDAQLALSQYDAALTSYNLAAGTTRTPTKQAEFLERMVRLYELSGQTALAIQSYDSILQIAQNQAYRANIEFRAAETLFNNGDPVQGLSRFQRIFTIYEIYPEAYDAMNKLLDNGRVLDQYQQGRVRFFYGDYLGAIDSFNTYTTQVLLDNVPADLHLKLGQAYRAVGNPAAALVAFQTILEQYVTDPLFGEALLETGRTHFLSGNIDTAIGRYLEIADTYSPLTETAAEALWRAGYLYGTNGNSIESRAIFERLANTYPDTDQARSGLAIAAAAALNSGDALGAEQLFSRLAGISSGDEQASSYLQVGRLALERGDTDGANESFSRAIISLPDSYFSARASDIMQGLAPFTPPSNFVWQSDDIAEITEAESWLRATFNITQQGSLWPLSSTLENESHFQRGRELWILGAFEDANDEFYDLLNIYKQDALASYQLAVNFRIMGSYTPSMQGAANIITLVGIATVDAPDYIAKMRYPIYYRDEVLRIGAQYNIDPLLLFSLIRHESLFNTYATAAAGEKGLTQVIPGTGEYIAEQLNWTNYQHSDLFRPYAGIEFGAYYLNEQLTRFENNTYAALAGYNAGPGRAIDWLALSGGDPDLFMTTITIESVQLYIQLIYKNYNIYRTLYGM